jgi:hypothetical protein
VSTRLALGLLVALVCSCASDPSGSSQAEEVERLQVAIPADAVAVSAGRLWIASGDRVLSVDPRTGNTMTSSRLPGSEVVGTLEVGPGEVWAATDAGLFRINQTTGSVQRTHVEYSRVADRGLGAVWSQNGDGTISRVDPETGEIRSTLMAAEDLGDLRSRTSVDIAAGSAGVWLADGTTGEIVRVAADGRSVTERIAIGPAFEHLDSGAVREGAYPHVVETGGGWVWACCNLRGAVVQIDPDVNRVIRTIPVGGGLQVDLAYGEGGLFVGAAGLYRIDPGDGEVTGPVAFPFNYRMAVGDEAVWGVRGEHEPTVAWIPLDRLM